MALLSVFLFLLSFVPSMVLSQSQILDMFSLFPTPALGPESLAFGLTGDGPYTGLSDGRIVKYDGPTRGFVDFAYISPNRTREHCDGTRDINRTAVCGRPIGIGFYQRTSELYVADASFGLCKVGPQGGLAQQVATSADGLPFVWLDGLDVDQNTGIVYFTDVSRIYSFRQIQEHIRNGDTSGRLVSFDPRTNETRVLMTGLQGPGGVAVSKDSSFVLVSEILANRIQKYWLTGPRANTGGLFMSIPSPANMRRTTSGDFWVASNLQRSPVATPRGVKVDESGRVLQVLTLGGVYTNTSINEVQEYGDSIYIGSITLDFAGAARTSITPGLAV